MIDELSKIVKRTEDFYLHELAEILVSHNISCLSCGRKLTQEAVRAYEHPHGILVRGYEDSYHNPQKMWVYFACSFCTFESAFWKLLTVIALQSVGDKLGIF